MRATVAASAVMDSTRRRLLALGGLAAAGALAGCSTGDDGGSAATSTATRQRETATFDYGGWLDDVGNYDGTTVDARGNDEVEIAVGAEGNGGSFAFDPPAVQVDTGTPVTWLWTGRGGTHNAVAASGDWRSGAPTAASGTTFERTFEEPAVVRYRCEPHENLGMKGAILVGDGS